MLTVKKMVSKRNEPNSNRCIAINLTKQCLNASQVEFRYEFKHELTWMLDWAILSVVQLHVSVVFTYRPS